MAKLNYFLMLNSLFALQNNRCAEIGSTQGASRLPIISLYIKSRV